MNLAYFVVIFDHATDVLFDALGIGDEYRRATGKALFVVETHTLYEHEVGDGERLRVGTSLIGGDAKRLHFFHEMFHAETGLRAAAQELLSLHVDLATRRTAPFPPDRQAAITARLRPGAALPQGAGRRISMPGGAQP